MTILPTLIIPEIRDFILRFPLADIPEQDNIQFIAEKNAQKGAGDTMLLDRLARGLRVSNEPGNSAFAYISAELDENGDTTICFGKDQDDDELVVGSEDNVRIRLAVLEKHVINAYAIRLSNTPVAGLVSELDASSEMDM